MIFAKKKKTLGVVRWPPRGSGDFYPSITLPWVFRSTMPAVCRGSVRVLCFLVLPIGWLHRVREWGFVSVFPCRWRVWVRIVGSLAMPRFLGKRPKIGRSVGILLRLVGSPSLLASSIVQWLFSPFLVVLMWKVFCLCMCVGLTLEVDSTNTLTVLPHYSAYQCGRTWFTFTHKWPNSCLKLKTTIHNLKQASI